MEVAFISAVRTIAFLSSLGSVSLCKGLSMMGGCPPLTQPHLAIHLLLDVCWRRSKREQK